MAPPPPSTAPRVIALVLKVFMFALLLASLVVLVTDTATVPLDIIFELKVRFDDVYTYRYVLASIIIGLVYSLLQTAFSLYHLATGNRLISGDGGFVFDFYGDKVISYVMATGCAAGFGATTDLKALADARKLDFEDYFDKAYASASLLLLAFLCAAVLSVFSSYALPKMVNESG
ncbi:CASP-like protein 4D1 [Herrania umbratica]|uniref:CASP-like protein n=1 Tax=Herrania umbratica TaxID=108875 RepID=A0A6J1B9Y1_9ROSI|nr:CASP-like protein 4D1 [Herrania umbratica]